MLHPSIKHGCSIILFSARVDKLRKLAPLVHRILLFHKFIHFQVFYAKRGSRTFCLAREHKLLYIFDHVTNKTPMVSPQTSPICVSISSVIFFPQNIEAVLTCFSEDCRFLCKILLRKSPTFISNASKTFFLVQNLQSIERIDSKNASTRSPTNRNPSSYSVHEAGRVIHQDKNRALTRALLEIMFFPRG